MKNVFQKALLASVCLIGVGGAMAQNEIFGGYKDFSERDMGQFFIPDSRFMCADAGEKIFSLLYDEDDCLVGFGVLDKDLKCEKELRTYTPNYGTVILESKYTGDTDWTEYYRNTDKNGCSYVGYYDASDALLFDAFEGDYYNTLVNVTQTLFNDDSAYELIQPVYGESRIVGYSSSFTRREIYINHVVTEFNVVDENGKVLYAIKPKSGFFFRNDPNVLRLGNRYYFVAVMHEMALGSDGVACFYEINKSENSVKLVREMRRHTN